MNHYQKSILEITHCQESDVDEIEDIMRNTILHSTLDWLSAKQFNKYALEAYDVFLEIKRYNSLSSKLFNKEYWQCSESELRQIELALPERIILNV